MRSGRRPVISTRIDGGSSEKRPLPEWATRLANARAYERLRALLDSEFPDRELITTARGSSPNWKLETVEGANTSTEPAFERAVEIGLTVKYHHIYDENGDLQRTPEIPWDKLTSTVPRGMAGTLRIPARTYTAVLPVLCHRELPRREVVSNDSG